MYEPGEDDIVEHDGGPLRLPGWARRPRWLPASGWRPSRGASVLGIAGLIAGLIAGYAVGHGQLAGASRPPSGTASPSPALSVSASGFVINGPAAGISGLTGTEIQQTAGACSAQHGHELQLGVEVINLSGTTVTLGLVKPILPLGGLRAVAEQWAPCGAISPSGLVQGGDGTVTFVQGPPGQSSGAVQGDDVVPPGGTAWFSITFQVLRSCPGPLPVQFSLAYQGATAPGTASLPGFPDLSRVPYTGCTNS